MDNNVISLRPQQQQNRLLPDSPAAIEQKTILSLRHEGLSYKEISKRTGIPKSTVEYRLKQAPAQNLPVGRPTSNESPRTAPIQEPIVQTATHSGVQPQIVQDSDWTRKIRPTSIEISSNSTEFQEPHAGASKRSRPMGWLQFARLALILAPVVALTPWLVFTSAEVYGKEVGRVWGWLLAAGFEAFFLVLATLAPAASLRTDSPRVLLQSIPRLLKCCTWYAVLVAMAAYSYHSLALGVAEGRAAALTNVAAVATANAEITDLRQQRHELANTIARYEGQGWLGEARKLHGDLRALDGRLDAVRQRATETTPATIAAIEHRASVGKYLRLFALMINVFCIHLAVRSSTIPSTPTA